MLNLKKIGINTKGLSAIQILNLNDLNADQLQSYIDKINEIKNTEFDISCQPLYEYATALEDISASQSALLLSTQGLSNSQIQQTLAIQGLSTAEQYQAMVEAGLLESKKKLEYAELQNIIAQQVGDEEYTKAIMDHMALTTTINGEGNAIAKLTSKQLQSLVTSGLLTESQAQQLAMTTGVTIAETAQATTAMPLWITKIKAMTAATWKQVVATVAWLATNPVGWIMLAVGAIALLTTAIVTVNKFIDKHNQKVIEAGKTAHDTIEQAKSDLESLTSSAEEAVETYSRLIDGVNTLNNTNTGLSDEDYEDFIASSNELAELFPELIIGLDSEGNYILDLGDNAEEATSKINTLIEAQQRLVAEETENNLVDVFKGIKKETEDSTEELKKYQNELDNFRVNGFIADLQGAAGQSGGKNISLSKEYMDNVDSLELMNNVKKIVNDALGTNLEVESNDLTGEYFLDLTELTEEQYEQAIQALYLNSDLLSDKVSEQIELAINNTKSEINKEYQDELPEIFTALSDDDIYTSLDGNQKTLADLLISKLDYSSVRGEIARKYDNDISAYIKDVILKPFQDLTDEDKQTDL